MKALRIVLLCCVIGLALILGLVNPRAGREAVSSAWSNYAAAIEKSEYRAAYSMHSARFRRQYSFSEFTNFCHITTYPSTLKGRLQHYHSAPLLGRAGFVVSNAKLLLPVKWEDGIIPSVEMTRKDDNWNIDAIMIYAQ